MSFINERVQPEGLTFDDVLLVPAYSEVLPREVNIQTRFSRNIKLNIPIVSAAMDTVTEAPLAIALAREGGIGVIHKNMSIAEQAAQVRRVKRAENGMIYDPVTISKENTVGDALNLMRENKIGGIPVVDGNNILIGIVTNRDLRFQRDMMRRIEEVMTPGDRLITTHSTELSHASEVLLNSKIEKLPVVDDKGHLVGLITYKDITKVQDHPNACKDAKGRLRVAAGVGITPDALERVKALVAEDVDAVVLDSAHGHSIAMVRKLREIKEVYRFAGGDRRQRGYGRSGPVPDRKRGRRREGRHRAGFDLHDAHHRGRGRSPAFRDLRRGFGGGRNRRARHRRRRSALFGRSGEGTGCGRRLRDDRLYVRRHGGGSGRNDHLQRP